MSKHVVPCTLQPFNFSQQLKKHTYSAFLQRRARHAVEPLFVSRHLRPVDNASLKWPSHKYATIRRIRSASVQALNKHLRHAQRQNFMRLPAYTQITVKLFCRTHKIACTSLCIAKLRGKRASASEQVRN